jgi:peptidoglycan/xylan/chitin deacetylase (PgdA/CDA1 family)
MANWRFPGDKTIAVVTSWDSGPYTDRIMHRMLEQYGYKGTFYVSPERIGTEGYLDAETLRRIAADGHEIGSYGYGLTEAQTPVEGQRQLVESKTRLEGLFGKPITAFAYPEGFDPTQDEIVEAMRKMGYTSARTTEIADLITADSLAAGDRMRLPVTAHMTEGFLEVQTKWEAVEESNGGIFHLWGCSQPLGEDPQDWVDFECILGYLGGISHVWYATVGELISVITQGPA